MPKIIGLTGGIGSGKTTIAKYFESLNIPVYIADLEARNILDAEETIAEMKLAFGEEFIQNNKVDRKVLAKLVFNKPGEILKLNSIIHPKVEKHFKNWVLKNNSEPFLIKEAAILFESGSYRDCDEIILVTAPKETRIQRVMQRDNLTREEIESRMANQWSDEKKEELSDFIIVNINLDEAFKSAENILSILRNR